jgi:hypothetical protein
MMMPLDLPHAVYAQQALPAYKYVHQGRPDPILSWVSPLTKSSARTALASLENQIEELSTMPLGWDGYGALPISPATKYNALIALRGILSAAPSPDITPNPNGTVSFEWRTDQGEAHLEIGQTKVSFYIKPTSGNPIFIDASTENLLTHSIEIGYLVSGNLFPFRHSTPSVTEIILANYVSPAY